MSRQWELRLDDPGDRGDASQQRVRCGVPGCGDAFRRNNAPAHYQRRHRDWKLLLNSQRRAVGTPSVLSFFSSPAERGEDGSPPPGKRARRDQDAAGPPPSRQLDLEPESGVVGAQLQEEGAGGEDEAAAVPAEAPESVRCRGCHAACPRCRRCMACTRNQMTRWLLGLPSRANTASCGAASSTPHLFRSSRVGFTTVQPPALARATRRSLARAARARASNARPALASTSCAHCMWRRSCTMASLQ